MKWRKRIRNVIRESPKVTILLVIVALVMFPMYMMVAISLMTPAQLEKFPWFPVKLPVPESITAPRCGVVGITPAAVRLSVEGAAPLEIAIPTDSRFYMHFSDDSIDHDHWTQTPQTDSHSGVTVPTVIAQYRAANVWEVRQAGAAGGQYLIDGRAWSVPAGFTSVLPGLQLKDAAEGQLRVIEAASRRATEALKAADAVERVRDPVEQAQRRVEAVRACLEAEEAVPAAEKALSRAQELAGKARPLHVTFDEDLAAARERFQRAKINRDRAAARVGPYRGGLEAAARKGIEAMPAVEENGDVFKVERNEAVAVLSIDRPAQLTRTSGAVRVETQWRFAMDVRRPFQVRALVPRTAPEGREPVAGEPLAELFAARDVQLVWRDQGWWLDDRSLEELLPPGFVPAIEAPRGGDGAVWDIPSGQVVARAAAPKATAIATSTGTLLVGLAVQENHQWQIPPGDGRWAYSLRNDRETPFAVALDRAVTRAAPRAGAEDGEELYDLDVRPGDPLARLYVNRTRSVVSDSSGRWVTRQEEIPLNIPPGFVSHFATPAESKSKAQSLSANTVLARLAMPKVTLIVNDDFIILRLTGGDWGSGQWEYPLGEKETLQTVPVALSSTTGGAAAEVPAGGLVAEIRATRQAVLRYVNQTWQLADGTVIPMTDEDAQRHALTSFETASRRLEAARREVADNARGAAARLAEAQGTYDAAWREAVRVDQAAAFAGLTGPGEILDSARNRAVVHAGDVMARLYADKPDAQAADPGKPMLTHVRRDGQTLVVSFSHEVPLPVRAIAAAENGQQVSAGETVCTLLTPQRFAFENYREAAAYVVPFILNTVFVAVTSMVLGLFFASLSAYVFARFRFPGKALFYAMLMVLLMIPGVLNLIPLYIIVKQMNLLNSLWAIILPAIAGGQVVNVYIMRNNLEMLAKDLFDAARIDGASNFQTYWHIAMPLSKPILGTLAIFALLSEWNNYIWPWVVLKDQDKMTITAGLALLESQNLSDYGLQMAGSVIASLPLVILFFFMMNLFIRGIQSGAIKA